MQLYCLFIPSKYKFRSVNVVNDLLTDICVSRKVSFLETKPTKVSWIHLWVSFLFEFGFFVFVF